MTDVVEKQFILRVSPEIASQLRQSKFRIQFKRNGAVVMEEKGTQRSWNGKVVNLPCVLESHKSNDSCNFFKTGDIGQMILVDNDNFNPNSGLTPPTRNIVNKRWRPLPDSAFLSNCEKEVLRSIRGGADKLEIELVPAAEHVDSVDTEEVIQPPIPIAWRFVKPEKARARYQQQHQQRLSDNCDLDEDQLLDELTSQFDSLAPPSDENSDGDSSSSSEERKSISSASEKRPETEPSPESSSSSSSELVLAIEDLPQILDEEDNDFAPRFELPIQLASTEQSEPLCCADILQQLIVIDVDDPIRPTSDLPALKVEQIEDTKKGKEESAIPKKEQPSTNKPFISAVIPKVTESKVSLLLYPKRVPAKPKAKRYTHPKTTNIRSFFTAPKLACSVPKPLSAYSEEELAAKTWPLNELYSAKKQELISLQGKEKEKITKELADLEQQLLALLKE